MNSTRAKRAASLAASAALLALALYGCGDEETSDANAGGTGGTASGGSTGGRQTTAGTGGQSSGGKATSGGAAGAAGEGTALGGSTGAAGEGGSSATGGSAGSGSGGEAGASNCEPEVVVATPEFPTVMFVVDGSSSMSEDLGVASKWTAIEDAVNHAASLYQSSVNQGLVIYSDLDCGSQPVVEPLTDSAGAIGNELASFAPAGSGVTHVGVSVAAQNLGVSTGPRTLLLFLDGEPSEACAPSISGLDDTLANVHAAFVDQQVTTIPFGVGDGVSDATLEAIAAEGQSTQYYRILNPQRVWDVVEFLVRASVRCRFTLSSTVDMDTLELTLNGTEILRDAPRGWTPVSASEFDLSGTLCDEWAGAGLGLGELVVTACAL